MYPLISIIIPAYNHEAYIEESITSALHQTYPNTEVIVIDDGSKDKTANVIEELQQKYKFNFIRQKNNGLCTTLNTALKNLAKGQYVCMFASDDVIAADMIEILYKEIVKAGDDCAMVFGNANFIDENSQVVFIKADGTLSLNFNEGKQTFLQLYKKPYKYSKELNEVTYGDLLKGNFIPAMSTLIRLDTLHQVGLYDQNLGVEDYQMWLKLAAKYKIKYIDKVLASYRLHSSNSITASTSKLQQDTFNILLQNYPIAKKMFQTDNWIQGYAKYISIYLYTLNPKGLLHYLKQLPTLGLQIKILIKLFLMGFDTIKSKAIKKN